MHDGKHLSLIMPCRNEAGFLPDIINEVPAFFDEIIVVSNHSRDDTYETGLALAKVNKKLVMLRDDRTANGIGYGYAHMTGISAATGDVIVCADCDGTYPIEDVPQILEEMKLRRLLFVSCNRYPDSEIPLKLQLGVKILNAEILLLYGFRLHDSLSGMWVFEQHIADTLNLTEGDWNLSPQIKLNAHRQLGEQFSEIKIKQKIRYGETKQNYFETGLRHFHWIAKNRFVRPKHIQKADW